MLTVSIVLFKNNKEVLLSAIKSCLTSKLCNYIFLVDNSPTSDLKDLISDERIIYIHNPLNPGFGAAHNIAIKKAKDLGAKYNIVLNPDVYFDSEQIEYLFDYIEKDKKIGNLMPKVLYPNGDIQYLCKLLPTPYDWIGRRFNPFKTLVKKRNNLFELRFTEYNQIMEVPYLSGCFMFLRLEALEKIGLFDEKIFMYGEETDLCRRLILGGYKTVFYPKATIFHHFEKGSHKSWYLTKIGIQSALYYFNKWGWFFDKQRRVINKDILEKLKYKK